MGSNRLDRNGSAYRMAHVGGGKGQPDPERRRRRRVDGDRVAVEVDSTRSGKHNASGVFAFGCVIRDPEAGEVPWFFIDGQPVEVTVTALALARMTWHLCEQCESMAPGFTEAVFRTMADFAEAAAKGVDPFDAARGEVR